MAEELKQFDLIVELAGRGAAQHAGW